MVFISQVTADNHNHVGIDLASLYYEAALQQACAIIDDYVLSKVIGLSIHVLIAKCVLCILKHYPLLDLP